MYKCKTSCCSICLSKSCIITSGTLQEEGVGGGYDSRNSELMWLRNTIRWRCYNSDWMLHDKIGWPLITINLSIVWLHELQGKRQSMFSQPVTRGDTQYWSQIGSAVTPGSHHTTEIPGNIPRNHFKMQYFLTFNLITKWKYFMVTAPLQSCI